MTQEISLSKVRTRKYVVGSIDELGRFSISDNPAEHNDDTSASRECDRLAKSYPGKAFFFARLLGGSKYPRIVTFERF